MGRVLLAVVRTNGVAEADGGEVRTIGIGVGGILARNRAGK